MSYKVFIPKQILILLALSVVLNLVRIVLFGNSKLIYLLWNIFLATLPFVLSAVLLHFNSKKRLSNFLFVGGSIVWLILLPNAPYIVTDLIHIGYGPASQIFYNAVLLFSCALTGLALGLYSISHMHKVFESRFNKNTTSTLVIIVMFLSSFGVAIGRFLRFNSWDILVNVNTLLKSISNVFIHPQLYVHVYIITGTFFFFLFMTYSAWNYRILNK